MFAGEVGPTAARGNNLVAVTPPSPTYARPAIEGLLGRVGGGRAALLLCPPAEVETWGALLHALVRGSPLRVQVARGEARAARQLRAGAVDFLIASPDTALALLRRSALKPETLAAIVLAWPERLDEGDALSQLMHDLPRDAQRIVVTALPDRAQDLVERYARKALTIAVPGPTAASTSTSQRGSGIRAVSVPWDRRAAALGEVIELLDPDSAVIWTADPTQRDVIERAVPLSEDEIQLATGDAPPASIIIAFDLPTAARLAQMRQAGDVVLLVPPGTEPYAALIAPTQRPLRLSGALEVATREAEARRRAITEALEARNPARALLTLAPLFERHDPSAVAAALYELWTAPEPSPAPTVAAVSTAPTAAAAPVASRVWVGIGKTDGVTANDFVGLMTRELHVSREAIGRIELRDAYSLIEVPGKDAEDIARGLNGNTIRRKRLVARVDRGAPAGRSGPGSRTGRR